MVRQCVTKRNSWRSLIRRRLFQKNEDNTEPGWLDCVHLSLNYGSWIYIKQTIWRQPFLYVEFLLSRSDPSSFLSIFTSVHNIKSWWEISIPSPTVKNPILSVSFFLLLLFLLSSQIWIGEIEFDVDMEITCNYGIKDEKKDFWKFHQWIDRYPLKMYEYRNIICFCNRHRHRLVAYIWYLW